MEEQVIHSENRETGEPKNTFKYFPFFNQKQAVFALTLIGIIFYCTSLYNEYALDDGIVIHQNGDVLKGAVGIKDIMTKDLYHSFYERMNASDQLQGGRYHPLSVITFALEQELIGTYRTGYYQYVTDLNQNGILDKEKVFYSTSVPESEKANALFSKQKTNQQLRTTKQVSNYEYNEFVDLNKDGIAQQGECNNCWDLNKNFHNDASEDLNQDGIFNEVDCQVKGAKLRHLNNIWLYVLACILLYLVFSRVFFKSSQDMAFLAALIFMVHPVHSEIVANVRGRGEIFSMLFIALTFLLSFRFMETKKIVTLLSASLMFFLALLSKEYSVMLVLLLPVAMYVFNKEKISFGMFAIITLLFMVTCAILIYLKLALSASMPGILLVLSGTVLFPAIVLAFFRKTFIKKDLNTLMVGIYTLTLFYLGLRLNAVSIAPGIPDTEILNNPFLLASGEEKFATKIFVLLKYLGLSLFPKTLCSDYSFDTIGYKHFTDFGFILSLLINLSLLVLGILFTIRRHILGFAILTYFAFLFLVSNFLFLIGAVLREGFLFHASMGVAIALSWLIMTGFEKLSAFNFSVKRSALLIVIIIALFLCGEKTWERNWDWKNDVTLFLKDVKTNPNSVLILGNAGARWIDLADTKEITGIPLPGENSTVFNDYNGTLKITDEELQASGYKTKREVALEKGIGYLKRAVQLHPRYVNGYLNLGLASFKLGIDTTAIYYWKVAEHLYPENPYLQNYYAVYSNILKERGTKAFAAGNIQDALTAYTMWTIVKPKEAEAWYNLGGTFFNLHRKDKALESWQRALALNPNYEEVKIAMNMLTSQQNH